ncbi:hypothetical protein H6F43_03770 [Leptolyngbya sp. FACHB-36]|uniref:hypothetical protein n=1 Tax=Leptolyngbya sp. FACHB-36 TaxID=2692808 RepID=UPI0016804C4A|nr:hypothetical protein [Leptolyngbya sp. FACHB-36]MBD2019300.1 hypothetical protein [Leptolyngbya sp. FACHB-36]
MEHWTQQDCEKRYVEGEEITLKELVDLSKVPLSTLKKWCAKGNWKTARSNFQRQLTQQTREKTIEKTSDRLSDELSELTLEHIEAYRICRLIASIKGKHALKKLEAAFPASDEESDDPIAAEFAETRKSEALKAIDVSVLNFLSLVIDRSVRGERLAAGLDYENLNKAMATIEQAGMQAVVKDNALLTKLVTAQARQER